MAKITTKKENTPPDTPPSGYSRLFPQGGNWRYVDDTGTVYTLATGITAEEVHDIVGELVKDSDSILWNYDDPNDDLYAAVIPGGVDHDLLFNFVANEHIDHSAVSVSAGAGLTGGGDLTTSRSLAIDVTGVTASSYGSATQVPTFTVNNRGQLSAASNVAIAIPASQVTDFSEATQDAIGGMLADTASIDFTYNDAGNQISAVVLPAGVDHNSLANYSANRHIDHSAVSVSAGAGLTGGGDLTATRTLALTTTGVTASSYGSATQVGSFTVDAYGRLTAASNVSISLASGQVSDFSEAAQDAVGGILTDSSSVDFTYNDAGNTITAVVLPGGVDHNSLLNYVANRHIDHSAVSITAGTGLSGGGDLTATRTLSLGTAGTSGTYGDATHFPTITTDAYGRVTGVSLNTVISSQWVDDGFYLTWSDATGKNLIIRQANDGIGSAYIRQVQSRGSVASPTAVLNGDRLGGNGYYGWNSGGADSLPSVAINGYASENHTPTANGGQLQIEIIPNGSTTPVTAVTVLNNSIVTLADGLRVGNSSDTTEGTIRFNAGELLIRQAGGWVVVAPIPASYNSTTPISTTSGTFSTMSGLSATPAAGTYRADFSCDCAINADSNGDIALFIGASEVTLARRNYSNVVSGTATGSISGSVAFSTLITVNGSQTVTVQYRENASGTFSVNARELILTPISR